MSYSAYLMENWSVASFLTNTYTIATAFVISGGEPTTFLPTNKAVYPEERKIVYTNHTTGRFILENSQ